ncbi:MAG: NAD-dependent epimerase/dehydratase family protein, partial [Deltaproteobacteria bacterium]|nr:NAD-dependent epimerase/dehydratase family protein [Deltaproteobacteria bacterium]
MKIFITGATGFVGTHLIHRLTSMDHKTVCLVRRNTDIRELVKTDADIVWGDIRDKGALRQGMKGCGWVFHLAGVSSFWEADKSIYDQTNIEGTRNVMECALETGASKVVLLSSMAVYGKPSRSPFHEEDTIGPKRFSRYALSRYEGDLVAWGLHYKKGLPLVVCYPGVVLGAESNNHLSTIIRRLIQHRMPAKAFMDSIHTYTHVNDLAHAIIQAAQKEDSIGRRYFIGDTRMTVRELLEMISSISGVRPPSITLMDSVAMICAQLFSAFADIRKRPPVLGMAVDFVRTLREGISADGTKAQQELGIQYTPVKEALAEEIDFIRMKERLYDRRRAERMKIDMDVAYKSQDQDHEMNAHLNDISESGMFLKTENPSTKGNYISANLYGDKHGRYFYVRGKVLRKTHSGMAVE